MEYSRSPRPEYPAPRRVATAPIPLSAQFAAPPSDGLVETLYNHPNAKIVAFTASGRALSRSLGRNSVFPVEEEPGTLSWSSQLERTIAVGPFRIYRAPGSVAFLNCGSALQPILPKSQCWCIDEVNSKFVLQIRRPNYWRIELPVSEIEDQDRAQDLRRVLDQILQFEKTECPFKRSFTVTLPERPQTPVKKRPWTPIRRPLSAISPGELPSSVSRPSTMPKQTPSPALSRARSAQAFEDYVSPTRRRSCGPGTSSTASETENSIEVPKGRATRTTETGSMQQALDEVTSDRDIRLMNDQPISEDHVEIPPLHEDRTFSLDSESTQDVHASSGQRSNSGISREPPLAVVEETVLAIEERILSARSQELRAQPTVQEDDVLVYELHEGSGYQGDRMKTRLRRRAGFASMRSFTSPPGLFTTRATVTERSEDTNPTPSPESPISDGPPCPDIFGPKDAHEADELRHVRRGSEDSFHSVQSWHSQDVRLPPSPLTSQPDSPTEFSDPFDHGASSRNEGLGENMPNELAAQRTQDSWDTESDGGSDVSLQSVTTAPDRLTDTELDSPICHDASDANGENPPTNSGNYRPTAGHCTTTGSISVRRRTLSPLPPAANLFSPNSTTQRRQPNRSKLETVKKLPFAIIAKTCEMIMGPPSHLITLMLKVASKIAAGQWRGLVYGYNDSGEQIPVQWDYSDGEFSDWSDDEPYMRFHDVSRPNVMDQGSGGDLAESSDDSRSWGVD